MQVLNLDPFNTPVWRGQHSNELPSDGSADVLYSSHSLEHVADVDETLSDFAATLKSGGLCLIEVPDLSRHWPTSEPAFREPHTFYFARDFSASLGPKFSLELLRPLAEDEAWTPALLACHRRALQRRSSDSVQENAFVTLARSSARL